MLQTERNASLGGAPSAVNGVYMPPALRLHTRRLQSTREDGAEQHADDVVVLWWQPEDMPPKKYHWPDTEWAAGQWRLLQNGRLKQRELRHFFRQQ